VLIHGTGFVAPSAPGNPKDCFGQKPCCPNMAGIQATWAGLEAALAQNLTRAIGVSNFMVPQLSAVLATATVPPAVNQMRTFVGYHDEPTFAFCQAHNVPAAPHFNS
jgi:diketogulonate reductase-like aldo/keto reductase